MSILGNIISKIFHAAGSNLTASISPEATQSAQSMASGPATAQSPSQPSQSAAPAVTPQSGQAQAPAQLTNVDVEAVLGNLAAKNGEGLHWQSSIVDLMKLLDLDSSHEARKELAKELNYTGDMNDSAAMNIWLHKQVMTKLAENGGVVPESLRAA